MVDDEWYEILHQWTWYFTGAYAARDIGGRNNKEIVYMHRYICMAPEGYEVDHINGNKLDNRIKNLRIVKPAQNHFNRAKQSNNKTGFKGVCWDKSRSKYIASIQANGKQKNLGRFDSPIDAAKAYNKAAVELHGEYVRLNDLSHLKSHS